MVHNLQEVLTAAGVDLNGIDLFDIRDVSADGRVFVGASSIGGYRVVLPEPSTIALLVVGLAGALSLRLRSLNQQKGT